ncbi:hypothetical protein NKI56_19140 [Mesorhizobium sp. M0622]|uniref:hypothetical protein n=1 Tax=unclassified Mesorhizobium TaxID=325217 RepID=UPI0033350837
MFREFVPGACVAKAFNHIDVQVLPEPPVSSSQRVLFDSCDDVDAEAKIRKIIERTLAGSKGRTTGRATVRSLAATNFIKI